MPKIETYELFWAAAEQLDPEGFARARREHAELAALRIDAERWRALCARLAMRRTPALTAWKIVETSPTFRDEQEVRDWERQVDEIAVARRARL
jgi:hypothetical protein